MKSTSKARVLFLHLMVGTFVASISLGCADNESGKRAVTLISQGDILKKAVNSRVKEGVPLGQITFDENDKTGLFVKNGGIARPSTVAANAPSSDAWGFTPEMTALILADSPEAFRLAVLPVSQETCIAVNHKLKIVDAGFFSKPTVPAAEISYNWNENWPRKLAGRKTGCVQNLTIGKFPWSSSNYFFYQVLDSK